MGRFREATVLTLMLATVSAIGQIHPLIYPERQVVEAGIMSPEPDGNFRAEASLTRAELASILVKTFDIEQRRIRHTQQTWSRSTDLEDVSTLHWAYPEIQSVIQTGVMTPFPGDRFMPDQTVTRAEGFAAIAQAHGEVTPPIEVSETILERFPDGQNVPEWARPSMASIVRKGWITLKEDQHIAPQEPLTRGDIARALSIYLSQNSHQLIDVNTGSIQFFEMDTSLTQQCSWGDCVTWPARGITLQ
ncbi:MAG: S-layer homology domain-containing protein [Cyanobacteria bacterium J06638_20]